MQKPASRQGNVALPRAIHFVTVLIIATIACGSGSTEPTRPPTSTPTPTLAYSLGLPAVLANTDGIEVAVTEIRVLKTLGDVTSEERPSNDVFLVILADLTNTADSTECVYKRDFELAIDDVTFEMTELDEAKETVSRDYPGGFLGQCVRPGETEKTVLSFDTPRGGANVQLRFGSRNLLLGQMHYLISPLPTPTSTLTSTPPSTLTPTPTTLTSRVITGGLNVRSGPTTDAIAFASLEEGEEVIVEGRNEDGAWLLVATEEIQGWVSAEHVEPAFDIDSLDILDVIVPTPTQTSTPTDTPTPSVTPTPTQDYALQLPEGEWCNQNNTRVVCVSGFQYRRHIGYRSAASGSRYLVFAIGVGNRGRSDIHANPHDVSLVTDTGRTFSHSTATYSYSDHLTAVNIAPGNWASGAIVFVIPEDEGPDKIIYRGGILESSITVDLRSPPEN